MTKSIQLGCKLFVRFLKNSECHEISQSSLPIYFSYKSWPTRSDIVQFAKKRYFILKDLISALWIDNT